MMTATYDRLTAYARAIGSRAVTPGGMLRAVKAHGLPAALVPWRDSRKPRTPARHDDDRTYGRCLGAAIAAAKAGTVGVDANDALHGALILGGVAPKHFPLYLGYFRMTLRLQGQHPLYPVSGAVSRRAGSRYSFRWLGEWKTAPGSYQASTLHGLIGIKAIAYIARSGGLKRWRGAGGGVYRTAPVYARGGVAVHKCAAKRGRMWLVITPDGYGYHEPVVSDAACPTEHRRAAAAAIQAMRRRREILADRDRVIATAPRVWVAVQDSLESGNCVPVTMEVKQQLERLIGADGEVGAVRGDVVLALRKNDSYSVRAVAAAAKRMGI